MRHICIKTVGRLAVGENDHDLLCASAAVFQNLLCPIDAVLNVRAAACGQTAVSASEQRIQRIGIFCLCQVCICFHISVIADNRNPDALFIAGRCARPKELINKFLRRRFGVIQLVVIIHRAGQVNDQNGVDLGCRYLRRLALHRNGDFRDAFFLIHPFGSLCRLNAVLRRVLTVVLSAAIAVTGRTLRSISTASTMLKKRFFMFFFPPVSNFLMCFDAFLPAKVSCVSLYQNFSKKQVPKHPSKRPEIPVLSSFPLKNSRF